MREAKVADSYNKTNSEVITFNVVRPEVSDPEAAAVITTTITENDNVIELVFANTDEDGMSDSVLDEANYKIGSTTLPAGTEIEFIDNKNK